MKDVDYRTISLVEVADGLRAVGAEARTVFGGLNERQLNWKPNAKRWSVGQCFEHLVTSNRLMADAARSAIATGPVSLWQKLPWWPTVWGKEMIRTQGPKVGMKYTSPAKSTPPSGAPGDIIGRFVAQNAELEAWIRGMSEAQAQVIMISPFVKVITYSVLDGARLLVAHDWRHLEQARRVKIEMPKIT